MHRWVQAALAVVLVGVTGVGALWVRGDFTPVAQVEQPWSQAGEPPAPHGFGFGDATPEPEVAPDDDLWPAFADPQLPPGAVGATPSAASSTGPSSSPSTAVSSSPSSAASPVPETSADSVTTVPAPAPTILPAPDATPSAIPSAAPGAAAGERLSAVQQLARDLQQRAATAPAAPVEVTVASFNVLGSTHTEPGGNRAEMASGTERIEGVRQLLARHDVSVVGLQEFLPDQRRAFAQRVPGWEMYPALGADRRTGENSVAWRSDTWDLVRPAQVQVPDADGVERPMPYVLLRERASGLQTYVATFHDPADTRRFHHQERFREAAEERQVQLVDRLGATGVPLLVTGDMNERGDYFCAIAAGTTMTTPAGGSSSDGRCRPPAGAQLDWIFGSAGIAWTGYTVDRDDLVRRTSDHPIVVAQARIDPADFPHSRD